MDLHSHDLRFASHLELARLPYFDRRQGRLVLADPTLGPSIDMHTHVAHAFLFGGQANLDRLTASTDLWLPVEASVDLDVYANQNVSNRHRKRLVRHFFARAVLDPLGGGLLRSATVANLARDGVDLGIVASLLLPLDWPFFSRNATTQLLATAGRHDIVCLGSVHPGCRDPARRLDQQRRLGARGIKMHPFIQHTRPDDPRALRLQRLCGQRQMFVFWHCGPTGIEPWSVQQRSQVRYFERPVAELPETTFVLGHSGALQMDQALDLARRYPNVWLELSCQSLTNIRRILERGPRDRLVMGSDWPMYHQALPLAKILLATEGDAALRRQVLHDNAARLLGRPAAQA